MALEVSKPQRERPGFRHTSPRHVSASDEVRYARSSGAAVEPHRTNPTRQSSQVADVIVGPYANEVAGLPAVASESGGPSHTDTSHSGGFLDEFGVDTDDAIVRFTRDSLECSPRRRLLTGSKRCFGIVLAVRDRPPSER